MRKRFGHLRLADNQGTVTFGEVRRVLSRPSQPLTCALLPWRKLSGRACVALLSLTVGLTILSVATQTMAALQRGERSVSVTTLQTDLQRLGYFNGPITGYYGSITEDAVRRLQQEQRLVVDGVVGSQTQSAINSRLSAVSTPAQPSPSSAGLLQQGNRGDAVVTLQNKLTRWGYAVPATGYFGSMTANAVLNFQRARGLKVDGIVGSATQGALSSDPQVSSASNQGTPIGMMRQGSRGESVAALQRRLANLGYFSGTATGYFGPITANAVLNFQRDYRLQTDGVVGVNTAAALGMNNSNVSVVN
jgi:peptidoglycan hydrolase-like protein with peptidoglycan-binding domain